MLSADFLSVARGERSADLVLRNARVVNVFTGETVESSIAIHNGFIVGLGDYAGYAEHDLQGRYVVKTWKPLSRW